MNYSVINVCVLHTYRDYFDYLSPTLIPCIGARVWVPFRRQMRLGIVVGINTTTEVSDKLKLIAEIIDNDCCITQPMVEFYQWVAGYYQVPLSEVLPLVMPKKIRQGQSLALPLSDFYQLSLPKDQAYLQLTARASNYRALIDYLAASLKPVAKKTLLSQGFTNPQLQALVKKNVLNHQQVVNLSDWQGAGLEPALTLNGEQQQAVTAIRAHCCNYHCFLLQGVTGSGKTEVYLHLIADILAQNAQVLVLVPEIGLTPQLVQRFKARFSHPLVVIHSRLNDTERAHAWQAARENTAKLVIGTRAAVFTPMPALKLIILDEEHDSSFKQMQGVRYSARDVALMRAYRSGISIILGSATPSLESIYNGQKNKYTRLFLNERVLASTPLHYQVVDLRNVKIVDGLAPSTLKLIDTHLKQNNQVLVFINRRGFSPILLCHLCGFMMDCKACDSHLTLHRELNKLICHHCGLTQPIPVHCAACQSKELIPVGVGTQRIYAFLHAYFPTTSMLRIDRDEMSGKNDFEQTLALIHQGQVQLMVGTQMLAKGHHFPRLTLAVVIDADCGFYNQDFRAIEQLGQLLTQVSGRAGREQYPGQVVIQTHLPDHPLLLLLIKQGFEAFAQALLVLRQQAQLPPYAYLALIHAQDRELVKVQALLQAIKEQLKNAPIQVLGPAPSPMPRKANQHRMQLLLKSAQRQPLHLTLTALRHWLTLNKKYAAIRWHIDIDPQDLT